MLTNAPPPASANAPAATLAEKYPPQFSFCARPIFSSKKEEDIFLLGSALQVFGRCGEASIRTRQSKTIFAGGKGFALPRLLFQNGEDLVSAAQEGAGGMRGGFSVVIFATKFHTSLIFAKIVVTYE